MKPNTAKLLDGKYSVHGSYRLVCSSGAVTTIAARTATAGQLLNFRFPGASPYVGRWDFCVEWDEGVAD